MIECADCLCGCAAAHSVMAAGASCSAIAAFHTGISWTPTLTTCPQHYPVGAIRCVLPVNLEQGWPLQRAPTLNEGFPAQAGPLALARSDTHGWRIPRYLCCECEEACRQRQGLCSAIWDFVVDMFSDNLIISWELQQQSHRTYAKHWSRIFVQYTQRQ